MQSHKLEVVEQNESHSKKNCQKVKGFYLEQSKIRPSYISNVYDPSVKLEHLNGQ